MVRAVGFRHQGGVHHRVQIAAQAVRRIAQQRDADHAALPQGADEQVGVAGLHDGDLARQRPHIPQVAVQIRIVIQIAQHDGVGLHGPAAGELQAGATKTAGRIGEENTFRPARIIGGHLEAIDTQASESDSRHAFENMIARPAFAFAACEAIADPAEGDGVVADVVQAEMHIHFPCTRLAAERSAHADPRRLFRDVPCFVGRAGR